MKVRGDACACVSLWIGHSLGAVERACLLSVLRQGHSLALYCYSPPTGIPEGVELRDAAEIVPKDRMIRHKGGSVSLFSNLFRYEVQRRGLGTWLDCDIYLLKRLDGERPTLFGFEDAAARKINTGILRLPPDSPLLPPLVTLFDERSVPPWLPFRAAAASRWRLLTTGRSGLSEMPWGSAGPLALTALARLHGVDGAALPAEVLHPVPWWRAEWIRDPSLRLEDMVTHKTVALHLWNERIKQFKDEPAPRGSLLARLQAEGRLRPDRVEPAA